MRHYTLKRTVVRAGNAEEGTSDVLGEPGQGNGEGHTEEKASEPTKGTGEGDIMTTITDIDEKRSVEGDDVTVTI